MMKNNVVILILFSLLCTLSCEKSDGELLPSDDSYLIFGHFFGECIGEGCVEIFKLTDSQLFEDTNDLYPLGMTTGSDPYPGNFQQLDQSIYEEVSALTDAVPSELLAEANMVFGEPDAGDWGGFYVEYFDGSSLKKWAIDTQKNSIPTYLHEFTDKIGEAIFNINN
jgi:hypothetical protein